MEVAITQFLDYLKFEKRYSQHTLISYQNDLSQMSDYLLSTFGKTALSEITTPIVRSWLASLKESGLNSRSVLRKISTLKSFFKYHIRVGTLTKSPLTGVASPRLPKRLPVFVEEKDLNTLFKHVEFSNDWNGLTDRLAMQLLYQLGLRLSELINCKESQVDFYNAQLKVLGKGNKERIIPLNNEVLEEIKNYISEKNKKFGTSKQAVSMTRSGLTGVSLNILLVNEKGNRLYPKYIYRMTNNYLQKVTTIQKKSPHVLRHSFATHLSNNGAELNAIKELLGHSSLAATQIYTHNTIEKLKNVHKKAHPKG